MTRPPTVLDLRLYGVLGLVAMLAPLATSFYLPGLPELANDLGASVAQAQLTVSSALIGLAIGQFVLGSVSDRYGRRRPMIVGMGVFAAATLLCAVAPNIWVLIGLRAIQGFAGAAGPVIGRASIRDLTSGARTAQALSRLLAVVGLAPVVGPLVGGLVLTFATWRGLFVALAVIGGISLVVSVIWFPETLPKERRLVGGNAGTWAAVKELMADRRVLVALAVTSLLGMVSFSWSATSPFYFIEGYGISPQLYAAIVAMNSAMFVLGAYVNSRSVGVLGPRGALVRGLSVMLVGVLLFAVTAIVWAPVVWPIVLTVLTMGAYGGMIANAQVLGLGPHGRLAGTMSALLGTAQFLGGAIVPPLVTAGLGPIVALPVLMVGATLAALLLVLRGVRAGGPAGTR